MKEQLNEELIENTYLFCRKRISDENDALDLSQDILCAAIAAIEAGKSFKDFHSWYWRVAKNKYTDFVRKKGKRELSLDKIEAMSAERGPEEALLEREKLSEMNRALSRLASLHREITVRFYLKGEPVKKIADELEIPIGTVKYYLFEARKEVRERIGKMRSCGRSSYAPAEVFLTFGGEITVTARVLAGKIAQQAMAICRENGASVNQIADEMGVAPVYLEPILGEMEEAGLLKCFGEKYAANCGVYPLQAYHDAEYEAYKIFRENSYPEKITDVLKSLESEITSLDFYGNDFEYSYLMWILYNLADCQFGLIGEKAYVKRFGGKYPDEAERPSRLTVRYLLPQEKLNRHEMKCVTVSYMRNVYDTPSMLEYMNAMDAPPFPAKPSWQRTERNTWVNAGNITLIEALAENPLKKLTPYEEGQAAELIEHGLMEKRGGGLRVMLPLIDKDVYDKMTALVSDALKPYAEEYSAATAGSIESILLPYVRRDLMSNFIHWDMKSFFMPGGYLCHYAINESGCLYKPEDYDRSAAALYILRNRRPNRTR